MAQVIVRNLEDDVVATLKRKAELHGCSLEQELRDILSAATKLKKEACLSGCNPHPLYVGCAVIRQARVSEWKLMF